MDVDYDALLPKVLESMFPDELERKSIKEKLNLYGQESFHVEIPRVRMGILKLVYNEPEKIDAFVELACCDFRDLLCASEYPETSQRWGLKENNPKKYKILSIKEENEYLDWLENVMHENK